eukprot:TRINITY_DN2253_c0_g1_i2.p1 TRINITY_DN2253_c0_g1~~TRINITY_DN2253_c0_g1_i2.p1  ORF type:complete len:474 (+),score=119.93 TRINITY_DN2253_c0_g1_i2:102-1523(+)
MGAKELEAAEQAALKTALDEAPTQPFALRLFGARVAGAALLLALGGRAAWTERSHAGEDKPVSVPEGAHLEQAWDPALNALEAKEAKLCNPQANQPREVHPRKFVMTEEWKDRCRNLPHQGHWSPPAAWGDAERNWCWVEIKQCAQKHRFDKKQHFKPPNWWFCQAEAAKKGHAPWPAQLNLYPLLNHEICDRTSNGNWHLPDNIDWDGNDWGGALQWFHENVDVFIINMPQNVKRLKIIGDRMNKLQIPFTRVDGISLTKPGELEAAWEKGLVPRNWSYEAAHEANTRQYVDSPTGYSKDALTETGLGTAGCTSAHLNAMKIASQSTKPLALILEDDLKLDNQFLPKLKRLILEEAPCDWEAINLLLYMTFGECISPHLARVHPDANEPKEVCGKGVNWSFGAVLYKVSKLPHVREELSKVVWNPWRPTCLVHDIAFASISDKMKYYGVPAQQYPGLASIFSDSGSDRVASN